MKSKEIAKDELIGALNIFKDATNALCQKWTNYDNVIGSIEFDTYPFHENFEKLVKDINIWVQDAKNDIENDIEIID